MLKSTAQAARASQWIENKLKRSITKNMMYPACSDMKLPAVIPFDSPDVARPLPRAKSEAGGAPARVARSGLSTIATYAHGNNRSLRAAMVFVEPASALCVAVAGEEVDALLAKGHAGAHILAALGGDRTAKQPPTNLAALRATAEVPTRMQAALVHAWLLTAACGRCTCSWNDHTVFFCRCWHRRARPSSITALLRTQRMPRLAYCRTKRCVWLPRGIKLMSDWVQCACVICASPGRLEVWS
jgi:hypothetical protein